MSKVGDFSAGLESAKTGSRLLDVSRWPDETEKFLHNNQIGLEKKHWNSQESQGGPNPSVKDSQRWSVSARPLKDPVCLPNETVCKLHSHRGMGQILSQEDKVLITCTGG